MNVQSYLKKKMLKMYNIFSKKINVTVLFNELISFAYGPKVMHLHHCQFMFVGMLIWCIIKLFPLLGVRQISFVCYLKLCSCSSQYPALFSSTEQLNSDHHWNFIPWCKNPISSFLLLFSSGWSKRFLSCSLPIINITDFSHQYATACWELK